MFNQPGSNQDNQNQDSQESSPFFSMEQPVFSSETVSEQKSEGKLFGLSSIQRFVIMILIFILTCVLGSLCLLLTGKIVLPL